MAIISTETKARTASSGNNKDMSFNLFNQQGTYKDLAKDAFILLIQAECLVVQSYIDSYTFLFLGVTHRHYTEQQHQCMELANIKKRPTYGKNVLIS